MLPLRLDSFTLTCTRHCLSKPGPFRARSFHINSRIMAQEHKLKIDSLNDLKPGEKREVEVDGIEEGKVLVVKVGAKVHAVSSKCTHYGAPLMKGALTGEGRLTCPWHGGEPGPNSLAIFHLPSWIADQCRRTTACFNVGTGDVEDAPALDPLASYPISEKGGAVYIKGDSATIKANRIHSNPQCTNQGQEKVVIVGGSVRVPSNATPTTLIYRYFLQRQRSYWGYRGPQEQWLQGLNHRRLTRALHTH